MFQPAGAGAGWCDHALSRAQSDKVKIFEAGYKTTTTTAESQTV